MAQGVNDVLTFRIELTLEVVRPGPLLARGLRALEAAHGRGDGRPLVRCARSAIPVLRAAAAEDGTLVTGMALARLEALVAEAPSPPGSEEALEEVAWALLRAARAAPPVSLGEDWDLLRLLLDPARRRRGGISVLASTLAGAALAGRGPLAARTGFSLARRASYATGWNDPAEVRRIARALRPWTRGRLEAVARRVPPEVARGVYAIGRGALTLSLGRAARALEKLKRAYATAAREGAGVFVELVLVDRGER